MTVEAGRGYAGRLHRSKITFREDCHLLLYSPSEVSNEQTIEETFHFLDQFCVASCTGPWWCQILCRYLIFLPCLMLIIRNLHKSGQMGGCDQSWLPNVLNFSSLLSLIKPTHRRRKIANFDKALSENGLYKFAFCSWGKGMNIIHIFKERPCLAGEEIQVHPFGGGKNSLFLHLWASSNCSKGQ